MNHNSHESQRQKILHKNVVNKTSSTSHVKKCELLVTKETAFDTKEAEFLFDIKANSEWSPFGRVDNHMNGYKEFIVPNIVHYVLLDINSIGFVHSLSIKSVLKVY